MKMEKMEKPKMTAAETMCSRELLAAWDEYEANIKGWPNAVTVTA